MKLQKETFKWNDEINEAMKMCLLLPGSRRQWRWEQLFTWFMLKDKLFMAREVKSKMSYYFDQKVTFFCQMERKEQINLNQMSMRTLTVVKCLI